MAAALFGLVLFLSAANGGTPGAAKAPRLGGDPLLLCVERFAKFDPALRTDGVVAACEKDVRLRLVSEC